MTATGALLAAIPGATPGATPGVTPDAAPGEEAAAGLGQGAVGRSGGSTAASGQKTAVPAGGGAVPSGAGLVAESAANPGDSVVAGSHFSGVLDRPSPEGTSCLESMPQSSASLLPVVGDHPTRPSLG
ncbi:hypothetical protein ACH429_14690 [Streptomyces pathocidini]|uniref:Uncharacterized protein n=1 Tax=Streptomyces pathocidini TaxID=1650571 RepID=A0ABW7URT5_9ACTN|nr:hypothetical protein [Streptomyces pathocidini]